MLDHETKRKIDNARDILVGKVPDPKSQVEQITIALIYKFMDDMDKESEEWGGKATFFSVEYEKYAWSKIFDPRMGGHEMTALYGEAIEKMNHNPNIPQLFRDIFKNAYLPYRDPETLKSFLKQINEFIYDHSERLGDAYEYLLSIMSKQGDAGQFRTPRHIIDFIVAVVDPKKNETVLDPACGTAGFLISSYKHIMKSNMKNSPGDRLTPEEKSRLIKNFSGYDISPDMVRLSLVNLYLHGFSNPHILEYDTLTSEERWNETADVFLANPPFMSPKGGIRPHKRFSIQARRSEVLFVDYIAEHLNPNGRAGVIVPEGIIFQSGTAYKKLRKMLVENYLWAVVSLPAGIFQPYSGVKTSILLMDKSLAKRINKILFVKVENDGFNLGAQRKPIDKNDLPEAYRVLHEWQKGNKAESAKADFVKKEEIEESRDYNLTGDRYQEVMDYSKVKWEMVKLEDVLDYEQPTNYIVESTKYSDEYDTPVLTAGKSFILGYTNERKGVFSAEKLPVIIFDDFTTATKLVDFPFKVKSSAMKILLAKKEKANTKFIFHIIQNIDFKPTQHKRFWISQYSQIKIPLPPLNIQKAIVDEIEGFQKIIDGARQVVDNYKPFIKIDPEWEMVSLKDIVRINSRTVNPEEKFGNEEFIYIDISSIENGTGVVNFNNLIKGKDAPSRARRVVQKDDILLSTVRPNLKAFCILSNVPRTVIASTGFAILSSTDKVVPQFVFYNLFGEFMQSQMIIRMGKGSYPSINQKDVEELKIPLPPLTIQKEIVAQIELEQEIVNSNKKLIEIYEQKIKDKIAEIWGE